MALDHERLAEKGYKQTGPAMPMTGPVKPDDVFHDLLKVMESIDHSQPSMDEVNLTTMREDAIKFVEEGKNKKWKDWHDYHMLIQEHDSEDEPIEEGLEAFREEADHDDTERKDPDDEDEDSDDDDKGAGDFDDGDKGDGSQPSAASDEEKTDYSDESSDGDAESSEGDADHGDGGVGVEDVSMEPVVEAPLPSGLQPSVSDATRSKDVMSAYKVLAAEAKRTHDDIALHYLKLLHR